LLIEVALMQLCSLKQESEKKKDWRIELTFYPFRNKHSENQALLHR
jgi:hypothetical protein